MSRKVTKNEAVKTLWYRGNLAWKLDNEQKAIHKFIHESNQKVFTLMISRRVGKSYLLNIIALEQCLKVPNSIVLYITPEQKQTRTIIRPLMNKLLIDCPQELRPEFKTQESAYRFPNGSEIRLVGTDGEQYESQRGIDSHLCIIDEAGFVSAPLEYIIQSVLIPTTLHTKGKIILSSTPPKTLDHPFITYVREADANGTLIVKTIYDFPRITKDEIDDIAKALPGGKDGSTFRREFLCKLEISEDINVVPEINDERLNIVQEQNEKPAFYDFYAGMDLGYRDATGILWAYLDFVNQKLIYTDEWLCKGRDVTLTAIAKAVEHKERVHFFDPISLDTKKPSVRVSDTDLIILNDLNINHKTHFFPTKKYDKNAIIAQFRHCISQGKIIINPRCKNLILQLKHATWNKKKDSYERSETMGHFDLVDAALYLFRAVDWKKNPYPKHYNLPKGQDVYYNPNYKESNAYEYVLNMFKPRFKSGSNNK